MNKYSNKKQEIDGIVFDSKKEAKRYLELKQKQEKGEIDNLQLQVPFTLIPSQKTSRETLRPVKYKADFVYYDNVKQTRIIEDVKGFRTPEYQIKKKLMMYELGLEIEEK